MAKSTKAPSSVKIVSAIVSKFAEGKKAFEELEITTIADQDKEIQKLVDYHLVNCKVTKAEYMKGNSAKNPARLEVKQLFEKLAELKYIGSGSVKTYQGCFWIAFESGVPFGRNLANEKTEAKKQETAKAESTAKSGKVVSTTRVELDKTLSKALLQARALGLTEFAATLLDHCIESLADFKEITSDK